MLAGKTYTRALFSPLAYYRDARPISFNLNAQYSNLSGVLGIRDGHNDKDRVIRFSGDNGVLKEYELKADGLPIDVNINVSGVLQLKIEGLGDDKNDNLVFAEPLLK